MKKSFLVVQSKILGLKESLMKKLSLTFALIGLLLTNGASSQRELSNTHPKRVGLGMQFVE